MPRHLEEVLFLMSEVPLYGYLPVCASTVSSLHAVPFAIAKEISTTHLLEMAMNKTSLYSTKNVLVSATKNVGLVRAWALPQAHFQGMPWPL